MTESSITLVFLIIAIVLFITELIPLAITAMGLSVGLVLTGVLTAKEAFSGFVDPNVLLFIAMFIIGAAIFETGMARRLGGLVTYFAKTERKLIVSLMIIAGIMSGFLSNTGTAVVLIPVVLGIAQKSGFCKKRLLLPIVIAAAMGGNLSLIGAPGNLIAQAGLQLDNKSFHFFEFAKIGVPILVVGIIYFAFMGHKLLPNVTSSVSISDKIVVENTTTAALWRQYFALVVLVLTVIAMVFEKSIGIPLFVSAWIGALILVAFRVIPEKTAMKSIDMKTIMLFVGSLSLAIALNKSGAGHSIANMMVGLMGDTPSPFVALVIIFIAAVLLTNFMSNTATTALLVPISLAIAEQLHADPKAVLMATVIGGSLAYATPIGMPANTMIYSVGDFRFIDYVKVGMPLILIAAVLSLVLLPILFPFFP